ncbi:hypothetical protein, partial [Bacillus coahuilensis]|uniref:hypothetical protein n=1 Tax=Bacillus coahuilensis TaxID=408580 RepID=UPI0019D3B96F
GAGKRRKSTARVARGAERSEEEEEEHRARAARCRKERGKGRRAPREWRAVQKGAKIMKVVTSLLSSK